MDKKMKKLINTIYSLKSIYMVNALIACAIFFIGMATSAQAKEIIGFQLIEEARVLAEREAIFVNARIKNDWEKMHDLQHPNFRKKISKDEMKYFEGWAAYDYRDQATINAHISGFFVPTVAYMEKHPNKIDPIGFPVPRRYRWSKNPFIKIKRHSVENISISKDGKYAKVKVMLEGRERMNPAIVRGLIEYDSKYSLTDYWEKVDGSWFITLLSKPVAISGVSVLNYFVPNDKSGWGKASFVELDAKNLTGSEKAK
jgi:hypothetical protein